MNPTANLIIVFIFLIIQQSTELDSRLFGKWEVLYSKDEHGIILKDNFYKKGYLETFLKNGTFLVDPNFLRDDMKRNGIQEPLNYADIPKFTWRISTNHNLEIFTSHGTQEIRYNFSGDTLLLNFSDGYTRYLLKK